MASEERDRNFDKALGRHLRSAAPSGGAANMSGGSASPAGACPDAEILAAYHERLLLPDEMNFWKEHIMACGNCQAVLAQLEATDEIPLRAAEEEEVLALWGSEPPVEAGSLVARSLAAVRSQGRADSSPVPQAKIRESRRARLLRGARWKWLAPAGAMAAGLLVWIALHENQRLPLPSQGEIQIAGKQPSPPLAPIVSPKPSAPPSNAQPSPSASRPMADEKASVNELVAESKALKQRQTAGYAASGVPSKGSSDKEGGLRKDAKREARDARQPVEPLSDLDTTTVAGAMENKADLAAKGQGQAQAQREALERVQAQEQAANVQSLNQPNAPAVPGPGPLGQMEATKKMKAAPSARALKPAARTGEGFQSANSMVEVVAASNPRLIPAPVSNVIWRVGRAGLIEFSTDGGTSWSRQTGGVLVDLLTGSAPSDKVCWIVGRIGAVLLTTDGGAHWKTVSSPLSEDLGGVRATDALHATIWNARNTKIFETVDGGATWKSVPSP